MRNLGIIISFNMNIQGPGASDDAVSCSVMLEIIQVFMTSFDNSQYPSPILFRDIIFLFNGAEEVLLAGSHGFITKVRGE